MNSEIHLPRRLSRTRNSIMRSIACLALAASCAVGCSHLSSTAKRSVVVGAGSAAGAAAGYQLGNHDPGATAAGAVAGGVLTSLALGRDKEVLTEGFDQGYMQEQSDAIKRQYFLRLAMEKRPLTQDAEGVEKTYYIPAPTDEAYSGDEEPGYLAIRVVE
jgi:uncharacterized protein YfiM (DUF2279 family)